MWWLIHIFRSNMDNFFFFLLLKTLQVASKNDPCSTVFFFPTVPIYVSIFSLTRRKRPHFSVQRRIIGNISTTVWLRSKEPMMGSVLSNPSLRYEDFCCCLQLRNNYSTDYILIININLKSLYLFYLHPQWLKKIFASCFFLISYSIQTWHNIHKEPVI